MQFIVQIKARTLLNQKKGRKYMRQTADKIIVLGIDGMDPRLTRKYVDQG